jgi:DNA polymerase-1
MFGADGWKVKRNLRQGVNYLIQGTCADLFKIALVRVYNLLKRDNCKSRIVAPIHDEIMFYYHTSELDLLKEIVANMEEFDFRVPIKVSLSYSRKNWNEKQELILS